MIVLYRNCAQKNWLSMEKVRTAHILCGPHNFECYSRKGSATAQYLCGLHNMRWKIAHSLKFVCQRNGHCADTQENLLPHKEFYGPQINKGTSGKRVWTTEGILRPHSSLELLTNPLSINSSLYFTVTTLHSLRIKTKAQILHSTEALICLLNYNLCSLLNTTSSLVCSNHP